MRPKREKYISLQVLEEIRGRVMKYSASGEGRTSMSRQPKQVHVYLYRKVNNGYEYAMFQRRDNPLWWQGICGGVEGEETLEEAAVRETYEEAGIADKSTLFRLDTMSYLPISIFNKKTQRTWGRDVVVVPMFFFAIPYSGDIKLSHEHTEVRSQVGTCHHSYY